GCISRRRATGWYACGSGPLGQRVLSLPRCGLGQPSSEKVSSLGKDWHKLCLKCDRCNKLLTTGGHAEVSGSLGVVRSRRTAGAEREDE
ncbi:hypothetical protein NHX12_019890, partial [Muraenolepis orangiensis]